MSVVLVQGIQNDTNHEFDESHTNHTEHRLTNILNYFRESANPAQIRPSNTVSQ